MVCQGIENYVNGTLSDIMAYPTTCDFHFWAKIMVGIFIILTAILYINDRRRELKVDLISNAGVSAIAVLVLSVIGTLLTIIQPEVFLEILVGSLIIIAIWIFKD